jgi:hypothetical protein
LIDWFEFSVPVQLSADLPTEPELDELLKEAGVSTDVVLEPSDHHLDTDNEYEESYPSSLEMLNFSQL